MILHIDIKVCTARHGKQSAAQSHRHSFAVPVCDPNGENSRNGRFYSMGEIKFEHPGLTKANCPSCIKYNHYATKYAPFTQGAECSALTRSSRR